MSHRVLWWISTVRPALRPYLGMWARALWSTLAAPSPRVEICSTATALTSRAPLKAWNVEKSTIFLWRPLMMFATAPSVNLWRSEQVNIKLSKTPVLLLKLWMLIYYFLCQAWMAKNNGKMIVNTLGHCTCVEVVVKLFHLYNHFLRSVWFFSSQLLVRQIFLMSKCRR